MLASSSFHSTAILFRLLAFASQRLLHLHVL
jgi:hypothetical protein